MPSKTERQARLFRAAKHGANFPLAKKLRRTMTLRQLAEFASKVKK